MMMPLGYHIVVLAATVMSAAHLISQEMGGPVEQVGVDVGVMVGQVVEHHLTGCHLVLITTTQHSHVFSSIIRLMSVSVEAIVVAEAGWVSQDQLTQDHLLKGLWGDTRTACRALILDVTTSNNNTHLTFRLAEAAELWKMPETRVVVVGGTEEVEGILLHNSFRNIVHALYLAVHFPLQAPLLYRNTRLRKIFQQEASVSERVWVYRRCLYCNNGEADVQLIHKRNITSFPQYVDDLFYHEPFHNFMGHKMQFSTVPYFPYMDYTRHSEEPGTIVTVKDSLDARLLSTFATKLNISFEIREQPERSWGLQKDGRFSGMVGQLQREEIDVSGPMATLAERIRVMEFLSAYKVDVMSIVSLKPTPLPQHLSLIRPFAGELWLALLVSVVAWGATLWILQRAWWFVARGRGVQFNTALLYGWGALLEKPPPDPSINISGQLLVGWWLVFCLVITTGFRSSLIAHLTVQGKSPPPENFEDLLARNNWKWGIEPWLLSGGVLLYFSRHTDPVVKQIYREIETVSLAEALQKVKGGGYSFLAVNFKIEVELASYHTDNYGQSPFYISKKGLVLIAAFGWGFRKGAPFYQRFRQLVLQLEDCGIIPYWTEELQAQRVKENRAAAAMETRAAVGNTLPDDNAEVVLGLNHLQGAFYLLFLGAFLSILTLLAENVNHSHSSPQANNNYSGKQEK
ncbi:uncharacterized protein LOC121873798 [Homarus americanus]|uniref:uncharacterized protein LOC121873798 n=1 Tax=Homarus americanus TaxID=6706 RepID=UPI001C47A974|nr:uncharacterized protein LOC121873798 [Homarus americanus]